jgi:hypothetical protein
MDILNYWPKVMPWKNQLVLYAQPKTDGYGVYLSKDNEGIKITGHQGTDYSMALDCPLIRPLADSLPSNSKLMAELLLKDSPAAQVITGIKTQDPRLFLNVFCVLQWDSMLMNTSCEETYIEACASQEDMLYRDLNISICRRLREITPYANLTPLQENLVITESIRTHQGRMRTEWIGPNSLEAYLQHCAIQLHIEGWVLKRTYYPAETTTWYKVKPISTCDAFITDIVPSYSFANKGEIASFVVSIWHEGKIVELSKVANGFTKELRQSLTLLYDTDPDQILGKVMEIAYDSLTNTIDDKYTLKSRLRFPRFLRWRDDKKSDECSSEQF